MNGSTPAPSSSGIGTTSNFCPNCLISYFGEHVCIGRPAMVFAICPDCGMGVIEGQGLEHVCLKRAAYSPLLSEIQALRRIGERIAVALEILAMKR